MPIKPLHPCKYPQCSQLTSSSYCHLHEHLVKKPFDNRETAIQRGYDTRWHKIRNIKIKMNPFCECECGCGRIANMVHHIDGNSRNNTMDNLISMNMICHNRKHIEQGQHFNKKKVYEY